MEETQVRCPQCGSTQIAPVRKDYDMGCGCLGLILFGWIGLLLGLLGGGDVEMVCANCGARWEPGRHNRSSSGCLASVFLVIVIVILLAGAFALFGAEPVNSTFRDNRGVTQGRAATIDNVTRYRNAHGATVGSATTNGRRTTFRDHRGASVGSSTTAGNRTTYRDSAGRVTGSATTSGNVTTYRDASGKITGSATRTGNRIIYRDASGRTTGTQVNQ